MGKDVIADLTEIQKVVKDAIDKGATSVEQGHQSIAKMPLKYLAKMRSEAEKLYKSELMPLFGFLLRLGELKTKLAQYALRLPEVNPRGTC